MKTKLEYQQAAGIAISFLHLISPVCDRLEIAGSLRRKKEMVGDIEIVAIPQRQPDLFGDAGASLLSPHLEELAINGSIIKGSKWGDKYKEIHLPGQKIKVDLFITTAEKWPVIFAQRTGSADFIHRRVTPRRHGGLLPSHLKVSEGRVWDGKTPIPLADEAAFLELCGGWVEPELRF